MEIGLGFCRSQLTSDIFRVAVQAGATHVVAHLTSSFAGRDPKIFSGDPRQIALGRMKALVQNTHALGPARIECQN